MLITQLQSTKHNNCAVEKRYEAMRVAMKRRRIQHIFRNSADRKTFINTMVVYVIRMNHERTIKWQGPIRYKRSYIKLSNNVPNDANSPSQAIFAGLKFMVRVYENRFHRHTDE